MKTENMAFVFFGDTAYPDAVGTKRVVSLDQHYEDELLEAMKEYDVLFVDVWRGEFKRNGLEAREDAIKRGIKTYGTSDATAASIWRTDGVIWRWELDWDYEG